MKNMVDKNCQKINFIKNAVSGQLFKDHSVDFEVDSETSDGAGEQNMKLDNKDIAEIAKQVASLLQPKNTDISQDKPQTAKVTTAKLKILQETNDDDHVITYVPVQTTIDSYILESLLGIRWRDEDYEFTGMAGSLLDTLITIIDNLGIYNCERHYCTPIAISTMVAIVQQQCVTLSNVHVVPASENGPSFNSGTLGVVYLNFARIAKAISGLDVTIKLIEKLIKSGGSGSLALGKTFDEYLSNKEKFNKRQLRHIQRVIRCGVIVDQNGLTFNSTANAGDESKYDAYPAQFSSFPRMIDVSECLVRIEEVREYLSTEEKDAAADNFFSKECRYDDFAIDPGEAPHIKNED